MDPGEEAAVAPRTASQASASFMATSPRPLDGVEEARVVAVDLEAVGVRRRSRGSARTGGRARSTRRRRRCGSRRPSSIAARVGTSAASDGRDVVAEAVLGGKEAGEDRRVGRPRERDVHRRLRDKRALGARCGPAAGVATARFAVAAQAVRAQGVDGHEHQVAGATPGPARAVRRRGKRRPRAQAPPGGRSARVRAGASRPFSRPRPSPATRMVSSARRA